MYATPTLPVRNQVGHMSSGPFSLSNFKIDLLVDYNGLTILGENFKSLKCYFASLDRKKIFEIFGKIFSSPQEVFEALESSFNGSDSDFKVFIDDAGKITIHQTLKMGKSLKTIFYGIQLEEEKLDKLQVCERLLGKIPLERGANLTSTENQLVRVIENLVLYCSELKNQLCDIKNIQNNNAYYYRY